MAGLKLRGVTKRFGSVLALDQVTLDVSEREFVSILGPSGCGKTTLLRMVAGFETPDEGTIELDGKVVARKGMSLAPEERELGMVFQSYALWPHLSAFENIAYGLRVRRVRGKELRRRVVEALELVGLEGCEDRKPEQLSGGQRQRVSLARCLVVRPRLVLLDEPLANLDANLREEMQTELRRIQRESGATFLFVTHDQEEALSLSDRVVVMDKGKVQQEDTPERLYQCPATPMVASFIGGGIVVPAVLISQDPWGRGKARLGSVVTEVRLPLENQKKVTNRTSLLSGATSSDGPGLVRNGAPCLLCVRTENLELVRSPREETDHGDVREQYMETFTGRVRWISYRGNGYLVGIEWKETPIRGDRVEFSVAGTGEGEYRACEFRALVPSDPPATGSTVQFRVRGAWVIPFNGST